ncbi:negative regulator of flagellin synthesis FlgM [Geomicrobium halophilum]|uniref:Negative regulator of flagellin synthesis n=1 Tax=Geomicrobium halophilum TaxID=549000 RepID=A0A841PRD6_9BACL|nr:flagellar biosynthesis anti-sigma factor FlgM [Geomicrobium halophilum]MBB6450374.1 negative regulator of flagellin synthesis FlgM [Geomicrobium halophilum]
MKIPSFGQVHHPYKLASEQAKQIQHSKEVKTDQVEISQDSKDMQMTVDTSRQAKIEALQKQIDAGEYQVDERAVAHRFYQYWNE